MSTPLSVIILSLFLKCITCIPGNDEDIVSDVSLMVSMYTVKNIVASCI